MDLIYKTTPVFSVSYILKEYMTCKRKKSDIGNSYNHSFVVFQRYKKVFLKSGLLTPCWFLSPAQKLCHPMSLRYSRPNSWQRPVHFKKGLVCPHINCRTMVLKIKTLQKSSIKGKIPIISLLSHKKYSF